jgi:hypothetical protein
MARPRRNPVPVVAPAAANPGAAPAAVNPVGNPSPLRGYLTDVLNIPLPVAKAVLEEGGSQTFADLIHLEDSRMVDIVKNCRKLTVPTAFNDAQEDPARDDDDNTAGAGTGNRLRVSDLACTRLRQLAFYCFHLDRIDSDRPFVSAGATVGALQRLWEWKKLQTEDEKLEVAEPEPLVKESATRQALGELDHYLI